MFLLCSATCKRTLGHAALRPPYNTHRLPFAASILQITSSYFSHAPQTELPPHCLPRLRGGSPYKHGDWLRPISVPLISTYCKHKRNFFRAKGASHSWQTARDVSTMKLLEYHGLLLFWEPWNKVL